MMWSAPIDRTISTRANLCQPIPATHQRKEIAMTITAPLSLRWERAQHIDRSAIEPLGLGEPALEISAPLTVQPGSTWDLPSG